MLVELTLTLTNLGHPQQSLPLLFVDNECVIGLATSSVRPKKSKSIDMRLIRLVQGEGLPTILPPCVYSWHQPHRLFQQNPSLPSTVTLLPSPSFTAPHTLIYLLPHPLHSPSYLIPIIGPVVATGTNLPSRLPLSSPHFVFTFPFPLSFRIASNSPLLTSILSPHLINRGINANVLANLPTPAPPPDVGH